MNSHNGTSHIKNVTSSDSPSKVGIEVAQSVLKNITHNGVERSL
jgi:hypothetical protein